MLVLTAANNALRVIFAFAFALSHLPRALDGRGSSRLLLTSVIKRIFFVKRMFRCCEKSYISACAKQPVSTVCELAVNYLAKLSVDVSGVFSHELSRKGLQYT